MARIKGALATRKRRNKTLKLAKGYFGAKSKLFKTAKEQVMHSLKCAYRDPSQIKFTISFISSWMSIIFVLIFLLYILRFKNLL